MSEIIYSDKELQKKTYFFVLSLLAFTGFEFFYRASILLVPIILYALLIFFNRNYSFNSNFIIVLIIGILTTLQTLFGFNENILIVFITCIYFLGYFLISRIIKFGFVTAYVRLVFVISLVSWFFFLITYNERLLDFFINNVAVHFRPLLISSEDSSLPLYESRNILVYNFMNYAFSYNRNSGPFWEPGMFAVFLNIALFFNVLKFKKLFSYQNIVFIITIITTFSTTGYLSLFFIFITYNLFYSSSNLKFLYIFILLLSSGFLFELDFMKDKIEGQISSAGKDGASRFGAILIHTQVINDYPFIGVGEGVSKYVSKYTDANSTSNGISLVFVKYGIPFGILYYLFLLKSCKNIVAHLTQKRDIYLGYCFFILLLLLAFSQDITVRHFYLFLIFWGLSLTQDLNRKSYKNRKLITNV